MVISAHSFHRHLLRWHHIHWSQYPYEIQRVSDIGAVRQPPTLELVDFKLSEKHSMNVFLMNALAEPFELFNCLPKSLTKVLAAFCDESKMRPMSRIVSDSPIVRAARQVQKKPSGAQSVVETMVGYVARPGNRVPTSTAFPKHEGCGCIQRREQAQARCLLFCYGLSKKKSLLSRETIQAQRAPASFHSTLAQRK